MIATAPSPPSLPPAAATARAVATDALAGAARTAHAATVPRRGVLIRARRAEAVALAGLAGFGAIFALVRARRSDAIDLALMLRLQRRRRPWLDRLMAAASWPGFPPQSRLIPPVLIGGLALVRFRTEAAFETIAWGTALVSTGLKALMDRPRPVAGTDLRVVVAPLGGSSFPSGHVITFVGVYGFAAWLAWTHVREPGMRVVATAVPLGLVALVGPSRVYQGHHWPTDVTASYLLGTTYLIVVVETYRRAKASERPTVLA
ncbi:MAG TPA: phosphatase PAP2 family protein [Candidatus Limnocylindrales bacterium]|nr:phosphatase PAP2 family protein [Candidatus Limnocylindrales bacterium]